MELLLSGSHAFHKTHGLGLKNLVDCQRPKPSKTGLFRAGCPRRGEILFAAHTPQQDLVELIGIEPTTSGLQSPRSPS